MFAARLALRLLLLPIATTPAAAPAAAHVCPPPAESVEAVPAGEAVIACIGSQPLSEATYKHWYEVAAADAGGERHKPSAHELLSQVMGFLLSAGWVKGEAKALGVHVSAAAVHRQFEEIRRRQFPKLSDFKRFLRKSKQTVVDLLMRVELDMLSQRIQRRITAGRRGAKAQQKALTRFITHFKDKWRNQTYCAPRYAVKDCGHLQANL